MNNEFKHIPRGTAGSPQSELQITYNALRVAELAKDEAVPRAKSFAEAVTMVRESSPGFEPELLDPGDFRWTG
ncbi:MAG TPA: hypothetical protein VKA76_14815 [Gammaproteobacteria bacterium]|nr:hypothetical protein [Gammaproteobacteria bacterium]HYW91874.1 hypothetical protein [Gammaproteobacteria bacterium]